MRKRITKKRQPQTKNLQFLQKNLWWISLVAINLILLLFLIVELKFVGKVSESKEVPFNEEDFLPQKIDPVEQQEQAVVFSLDDTTVISEITASSDSTSDQQSDIAVGSSVSGIEQGSLTSLIDEKEENSYIIEREKNIWAVATSDSIGFPNWKTILIKNRKKIDYTINPLTQTGEWEVLVNPGNKLILKQIKPKRKGIFSSQRSRSFALQLLSIKEESLEEALAIVKMLIQDGYYAYLYQTENKIPLSEKDHQYFYRVRVGYFENEHEVSKMGKEIVDRYSDKKIFNNNYWMAFLEYDEISGQLIDFVVQRYKPWFIELDIRQLKKDSITDLSRILSKIDFAYLSQQKTGKNTFRYRLRIGFYEKRKDASRMKDRLMERNPALFLKPRVVMIRTLQPTPPREEMEEKEELKEGATATPNASTQL